VIGIVVAQRGPAAPGESEGGPRLVTPLWSPRRVPQPIVETVATQRLQGELDEAIDGTDACFAVSGPEGLIASNSPDAQRIPASTLKLFTAAVALDVMGPDFTYETRAVAANRPQAGVVEKMWLVGSGDPVLTTPEAAEELASDPLTRGDVVTPLVALADKIRDEGVREIPGGIWGDDSRYDDTRYLSVWPSSYRADREIGPISALTVNDGFGGPDGTGAATDAPTNAADQLARLLILRGVNVGPGGAGRAPREPTTIASLESPPLRDILTAFLAGSDNLSGEMLTREIAARGDQPATTANGTTAIVKRLGDLGVNTAGVVMVDGSGLARGNRATCTALLATLSLANNPKLATLRDGIAVAGERGTLATRLEGTPLEGNLRAKTGSLSGVSGLAGYVTLKRPVEFSLLLNGDFGESFGITRREQMAESIGRYPDVPPPDELIPLPIAPTVP
jgi:D-alanyl-D-alanine carboxypeptidase/D-alanyl-D-alanine-endopeptidase (penicillin-binding protein 4)